MKLSPHLVAPYPYFGGKRRAAELVWSRFGVVKNYVEPFCGSLAVLLKAPEGKRMETVNDLNGFVVNFWRAVKADPEAVAAWANWPVSEIDLEARHGWLSNRAERLCWALGDPDYYDAKTAGWWSWGQATWIGSGWCTGAGPWVSNGVEFFSREPDRKDALPRVKRALPALSNNGMGVHRQISTDEAPTRSDFIRQWMAALSERIREVRIICGDWSRCVKPSVTTHHGLTAIFIDPPYKSEGVSKRLYQREAGVAAEAGVWCAEHGNNPLLRIAICGYEGDYNLPGWTVINGRATNSGYGGGAGNKNNLRERIWFSPHCHGA